MEDNSLKVQGIAEVLEAYLLCDHISEEAKERFLRELYERLSSIEE